MARRLFAVIVAALLMGLVFGGLRVAAAESSASQFSRTQQLARLGSQLVTVVDDLQAERDATLVALITDNDAGLAPLYAKTNRDLVPVRPELQRIVNGGFPATIATDAGAVSSALSSENVGQQLHQLFTSALPDGDVVSPDYEAVIDDIITLQAQVALGNTDQSLTNDVQTLTALAQAKDLTSQQLALLDQSTSNPAVNSPIGGYGFLDFATETSLQVDYSEEFNQEAAFQSSATEAENALYDSLLGPQAAKLDGETQSDNIEQAFFTVAGGQTNETQAKTVPIVTTDSNIDPPSTAISYPKFIDYEQLNPAANNPTTAEQDGITTIPQLKAAWDKGIDAKLAAMQQTEQFVAGNIVARATQLQQSAQQTALIYIIITVAVLLIVLLAALLVARSLVLPLRRLRTGALDVASVQLPERVRQLSEDPESAGSAEVAPIDVTSQDEIGEVARAFDRVHAEAVRLAGEQALLRASFNAMFVNLSRRSQTLIERLARMIDSLEQNEDDPDRLGSLFSIDHLVTRMRRNSENLLLLAGHENPRKWSQSAPLADVARAATSEIEQYNRVTLSIPPGISLTGSAVSDVVHLLAELIENATNFSPKDTPVRVTMQELTSGGVLMEVIDRGIGVSEDRLKEMNWRLDQPPQIDVSVSRHMGLFAVARLAQQHGVRVRLRQALPQGLSALVWLPDALIERDGAFAPANWSARRTSARTGNRAGAGVGAGVAESGAHLSIGQNGQNGRSGQFSQVGQSSPDYGDGYDSPGARKPLGWFRPGQSGAPLAPAAGPGAGAGPAASALSGWGESRGLASSLAADPATSDQTLAGLPVRVPRGNLGPGADAADGAAGHLPGAAAAGRANGSDSQSLPQRSPDQVRSRLSGFQRGTRRAEGQSGSGGQSPRAGEGTMS